MSLRNSYIVLAMTVWGLSLACAGSRRPSVEPISPAPTVQAPPVVERNFRPPTLTELEAVRSRIFKDTTVLDMRRQPVFITGDFNGDSSQDIALLLRPVSEKLSELNEQYPAWIAYDPFRRSDQDDQAVKFAASDSLLAIVHGYSESGWRDSQATQTFLMKNSGRSSLSTKSAKAFLTENATRLLPRIRGDVISETVPGRRGCLYFSGSAYEWYDPTTFKGEVQTTVVHGRSAVKHN